MTELHVMDALREKRSELSGIVSRLEQQLAQHRDESVKNLGRLRRALDCWVAKPSVQHRGPDLKHTMGAAG